MAELVILPAIYMGIIIGVYEAIAMYRDVSVKRQIWGHMVHALIYAIGATFAVMNIEFIFNTFSFLQSIPLIQNPIFFRIAIGLVTIIKVRGFSAAIPGGGMSSMSGMKEKWIHSLIVGVLIAVSPEIWPFLEPMITKFLPV